MLLPSWFTRVARLAAVVPPLACTPASPPATQAPNPPSSARTSTSAKPVTVAIAPAPTVSEETTTDEPPADPEPAECPPAETRAGFEHCEAVEITGAPPCETICWRPRQAAENKCCSGPVDAVVAVGDRDLLVVPACEFVPPDCANRHGHGNMDADLRVLKGPPPEVIVVEGGCEARALAHGYVPPGVAAWTGCKHERHAWNGRAFVKR